MLSLLAGCSRDHEASREQPLQGFFRVEKVRVAPGMLSGTGVTGSHDPLLKTPGENPKTIWKRVSLEFSADSVVVRGERLVQPPHGRYEYCRVSSAVPVGWRGHRVEVPHVSESASGYTFDRPDDLAQADTVWCKVLFEGGVFEVRRTESTIELTSEREALTLAPDDPATALLQRIEADRKLSDH